MSIFGAMNLSKSTLMMKIIFGAMNLSESTLKGENMKTLVKTKDNKSKAIKILKEGEYKKVQSRQFIVKVRRYKSDTALAVGRILPKDYDIVTVDDIPMELLHPILLNTLKGQNFTALLIRKVNENAIPTPIQG